MGDTGALAFGATLAVIGLLTGSIVALVVMGGIFVIEVTSSAIQMFGWKFLGRPILPLAPFHNAFLARGWEEPKMSCGRASGNYACHLWSLAVDYLKKCAEK